MATDSNSRVHTQGCRYFWDFHLVIITLSIRVHPIFIFFNLSHNRQFKVNTALHGKFRILQNSTNYASFTLSSSCSKISVNFIKKVSSLPPACSPQRQQVDAQEEPYRDLLKSYRRMTKKYFKESQLLDTRHSSHPLIS